MSNSNVVYRTLFIGLGGTGGEILCKLDDKLSSEQKERSHMLYLDLDKKATDSLEARSVPTVRISSSDTVRDVMNYLGDEDGVKDWLPHDLDCDNGFLSSSTDDGASQYRIKSRLCLAKYLDQRNSELTRLLDKVSTPGNQLANETLRVMIVSSVAGGTGAGTFIQMALYLRDYFRSHGHNDINIMGLFALPDLYVNAVQNDPGTKTNVANMYANAYAAIRELNAMNLAVAVGNKADGYGKAINIEIKTKSEGNLFDSNDPMFRQSANNKPFNRIYFIDVSSADGGVLRSLDQYYAVMADIVYSRLYSPFELKIRSDESNELGVLNNFPTAIYGSAGYSRIVYPYEGIIDYLATRKTFDELDSSWSAPENAWERYATEKKKIARLSGTRWSPTTEERGQRYISDMNDFMSKPRYKYLRAMIQESDSVKNRAEMFIDAIKAATKSGTGVEEKPDKADAKYGLGNNPEVSRIRKEIASGFRTKPDTTEKLSVETAVESIKSANDKANLYVDSYISELTKNNLGKASTIASQIIPKTAQDNILAINDNDPINIFNGLLSVDGQAIHPLAARYLLYFLRNKLKEEITSLSNAKEGLYKLRQWFDLGLDDDKTDDVYLTIETMVKKIKNKRFLSFEKDIIDPNTAVTDYFDNYGETLKEIMKKATDNLRYEIYLKVLESLDILIDLYEKLFDNLKIFKTDLSTRVDTEKRRHEQSSDVRCIFINASQREKEYIYSGDLKTREALDECADEIASAAGRGIYDALLARSWEKLEAKERLVLTDGYDGAEDTDDFTEMTGIFTNVISIYSKLLKENVPHLRANAVRALLRQSCFVQGVEEDKLGDNDIRVRVRTQFEEAISDMTNKAVPMLNFDRNNVDPYFDNETKEDQEAQTKYYMHFGIHPDVISEFLPLYPSSDANGAVGLFHNSVKDLGSIIQDPNFSRYEIVCFRLIHCLQPTQIYKFRESEFKGYYHAYKKRLELLNSGKGYSNTPHLDKRWHLREAMPYISRATELQWREKTIKAFVYAMLNRDLASTTYSGAKCFNYLLPGRDTASLVFWPAEKLVTQRDISKVIEYLAEQSELVEALCAEFDKDFEMILARLSNQCDEMAKYKTAVTTEPTLKKLYGNLLVADDTSSSAAVGHGSNAVIANKNALSEEEVRAMQDAAKGLHGEGDVLDVAMLSKSLGGLLELAWDVHKSEESQERDYDYGEAMLELGLGLVDKLARNMCGNKIEINTNAETEYKDLYNHILEKFIKYYVDAKLIERKLMDSKFIKKMEGEVFYKYARVPDFIKDENEYKWIVRHWKKK